VTVGGWAAQPAARLLDIYWIDVEGGASTLIVTAEGQSVLMDAGYAGHDDRDPTRIEHVIRQEAGLDRIDYMLTSHFHPDHAGGLAAVAGRVPIGTFIDYGDSVDRETSAGRVLWAEYLRVTGARRHVAVPGERLSLRNIEFTIVAANGRVLTAPVGVASANPSCAALAARPADAGENGRSLGYLLRAGDFTFLNLGDLPWNGQGRLVCPTNLLGHVDIAQAPHHAVRDDVLPQLLSGIRPTAVVMNNGPAKGGGAAAVETVLRSTGLDGAWSLHRVIANDAAHNAPEAQTANLGASDDCPGAWIRARVSTDGTYTITNSRNGYSKTYRVQR
jgi:beta-lactamase superfamily II metal-dependent hydrolase